MDVESEDVLEKIDELSRCIDDLNGLVSDVKETQKALVELKGMFEEEEKEEKEE